MPFSTAVTDRERDKFIESPAGETSVRVYVSNETGTAVPVTGTFTAGVASPTGPFRVTVATITDTSANPIVTALTNRVSLSIRNLSVTTTVYMGPTGAVTADNTPGTAGWDIGPGEDFHIDLDESNGFYMITPATETATLKIMEIASNSAGGGGGGGSSLTLKQEVPAGAIPGNTFTLTQVPTSNESVLFFVNGQMQIQGIDYSVSGFTITTTVSLTASETVSAFYWY